MTIREGSWHARLWRKSYAVCDRCPPTQTNLCPYFWRVIFAPVVILGSMVWNSLSKWIDEQDARDREHRGDRVRVSQSTEADEALTNLLRESESSLWAEVREAGLAVIVVYLGTNLVLLVGLLVFLAAQSLVRAGLMGTLIILGKVLLVIAAVLLALLMIVLLLMFLGSLFKRAWATETIELLWQFIVAKKKQVCPLIEFRSD